MHKAFATKLVHFLYHRVGLRARIQISYDSRLFPFCLFTYGNPSDAIWRIDVARFPADLLFTTCGNVFWGNRVSKLVAFDTYTKDLSKQFEMELDIDSYESTEMEKLPANLPPEVNNKYRK